jgi:gluconokinase
VIIVVMGVAGSGKTTIGRALAEALGWAFADADDEHDEASRAKMAAGTPLDEADRAPWLARLGALVTQWAAAARPTVLACSALRATHRDALRAAAGGDAPLRFVWLDLDPPLARRRARTRSGHFFAPELVAAQYATLEPPIDEPDVLRVDAALPPTLLVDRVRSVLDV